MSTERRLAVLRAIVEDYVETSEPVGSRSLAERHSLGVSPATVRNDMAALEDAGYITQPHTSAGRIPTDAGYRLFVDRLSTAKPLSSAERRAIANLLEGAVELDDIVDRTVRALAALTHQVALVQYPSLARSPVRHIELLALDETRILAVVIAENGRVTQRMVPLAHPLSADDVARLRLRANEIAVGKRLTEIGDDLTALASEFEHGLRSAIGQVAGALVEVLASHNEERVVLAGAAHLVESAIDFSGTVRPILEVIEEQVVMLKLLGEMAEDAGEVSVRIGSEHTQPGLAETSMVAAGYGAGREIMAHLGVLGPTRMDYPNSIAAVRAVARYLSRILST
ncbi:MAG: heat-inducible transcriptional repressor HrcA [Bifidobacteriaceae bacterium]|jgi:heat-inducible transcriptional repressor|nr:heat-inducible transcriptional repressor HrcA [Bifidobacteriaceae bacterium]